MSIKTSDATKQKINEDSCDNAKSMHEITPDCALLTLERAIEEVSPDYLFSPDISDEDSLIKAQTERCFTYELYHQWRNILDCLFGDSIKLNCEITKNVTSDYYKEPGDETLNFKKTKKFPDFVLHKGQNNCDNQVLACEVKRYNSCNKNLIYEDLLKLCDYMNFKFNESSPNVGFKKTAFIMTGCNLEEMKREITEAISANNNSNTFQNHASELICYAVEVIMDDNKPICLKWHKTSLYKIIGKNDN